MTDSLRNALLPVADALVLAVDDNPANTHLLRRVLERGGLTQVTEINDALEVMERVMATDIDLVLLDLRMPGRDGFQLLDDIRRHAGGTFLPIIMITSDDSRESIQRALELGAHDFLVKPVDSQELLLRVRNLLMHRRAYLELRRSRAWLRTRLDLFEPGLHLATTEPELVRTAIREVIDNDLLRMALQPVKDLRTGELHGYEALARFPSGIIGDTSVWLASAVAVGLGVELEMVAARRAIAHFDSLPEPLAIAINVSPAAVLSDLVAQLGDDVPWQRVVLELTEHAPVEDYAALNRALEPLRSRGARLAVDDTGAGFASLRHILDLHPDFIKLDIAIVRNVDSDPSRAAMAEMLLRFSERVGVDVIVEGVETEAERDTLIALGAVQGQGYLLGRPEIPTG